MLGVLAVILNASKPTIQEMKDTRRTAIYVFAIVLIISFVTENYFGIADITGAYLVRLFCSTYDIKHDIARKMTVSGYLFFSPVFFASIGIKTEIPGRFLRFNSKKQNQVAVF